MKTYKLQSFAIEKHYNYEPFMGFKLLAEFTNKKALKKYIKENKSSQVIFRVVNKYGTYSEDLSNGL